MRFRSPLSFPNRADGTILPAVLAGALSMAFAAQLVWTGSEQDLPPVMAVGAARANVAVPRIVPTTIARVIFDRPLFAPRQSFAAAANSAPPPVLGGATVAGTVSIRGRTFAVIRRANGRASNMTIGGVLDGWRLVSLGQQGAVFVKGQAKREIAYGTQPTQATEEPPSE